LCGAFLIFFWFFTKIHDWLSYRVGNQAEMIALKSNYKNYTEVVEIQDETVFEFDSKTDFVETFSPKRNLEQLGDFLALNNFNLKA